MRRISADSAAMWRRRSRRGTSKCRARRPSSESWTGLSKSHRGKRRPMWSAELDQEDVIKTGASVLLVDDDPLNVKLLMAFLDGEGYLLSSASSGIEALK